MRKTALIYLAAGNSRRFGRNKLLYEVDGRPMYLHLLERLMEIADADKRYELLVVTQYQEIRETVDNFRKEGPQSFLRLVAGKPKRGFFFNSGCPFAYREI